MMSKKILTLVLIVFVVIISLVTVILIRQTELTGFAVKDSGGLKVLNKEISQDNNIDTINTGVENSDPVSNPTSSSGSGSSGGSSGGGGGGGSESGESSSESGGESSESDGGDGGEDSQDKIAYISINPPASNHSQGENFTINIEINTQEEIFAVEFELSFESGLIEVLNVTKGNFLNKDGTETYSIIKFNNTKGEVKFANTRLGIQNGVSGTGLLATIDFRALSNGTSQLSLENVQFADPSLKVGEITVEISNGQVNIS